MIDKIYNIILEDEQIGTTFLENGDAPMGVVFGKINFGKITSGYNFFKDYCRAAKIEIIDYPDIKVISTRDIPSMKVYNSDGKEIKGLTSSVSGGDQEFEIIIEGIPYPFYEEEFPNHIKKYDDWLSKLSE